MQRTLIFALHGFLGQAKDWDQVKSFIKDPSVDFHATDLFSPHSAPILEFEDYIEKLSEEIDQVCQSYERKIFLGYSLGGRLGLHLLEFSPQQFDHFVFLSTHPGLSEGDSAEKNKRLLADMKWAQQISEKNWSTFLSEWNQQLVFQNSLVAEPLRSVEGYDLDKLKRALVMWSLSQQEDFQELIEQEQQKITWVVGEKDAKYLNLTESLKQKKILLEYKRIFSGHRIWLDQPEAIAELLTHLSRQLAFQNSVLK